MKHMRDFRDAKAMAHTLRGDLAAKGLRITNSQSLELIASAFGAADWNTLAAAINDEAMPRMDAATLPASIAETDPALPLSAGFVVTLHRALAVANQRKHEYATLEHLLLALTDDADALAVMTAGHADVVALAQNLVSYLDHELTRLVIADGADARPTAAFQRVVQRATRHALGSGSRAVTGANALAGLFAETRSPAVRLLGEQGITGQA
jgi:hypothetical protein